MTEEEAKTRWCPFVRAVNGKIKADGASEHDARQGSYNRIVGDGVWAFPKAGTCIGSGCMAWRWGFPVPQQTNGYCGLAGAPQ